MGSSKLKGAVGTATCLAAIGAILLVPSALPVASASPWQEPDAVRDDVPPVGSEAGYGPWVFGMSLDEVAAVEAHAPYEPVLASMGGLETYSGNLGSGVEKVSFVFNSADELYLIRVWYEIGDSYEETLASFHRSYVHLTETFGEARVDTGYPLEPGMSAEEFTSLVPERFEPTGEEFDFRADDAPTEFNMDVRQLRIAPVQQPAGVQVFCVFAKLHPTTNYVVNVFYQSVAHSR